eukprot:gene2036-5109_t
MDFGGEMPTVIFMFNMFLHLPWILITQKTLAKITCVSRFMFRKKEQAANVNSSQKDDSQDDQLTVAPTAPRRNRRVLREVAPPDDVIDANYHFKTFDAVRATLAALPTDHDIDLEKLDSVRSRRYQELQAVSKKLSSLVLDHHEEFMCELSRVGSLEDELSLALVVCKNGRRRMSHARNTVKNGLYIVNQQRKKDRMLLILKHLQGIHLLRTASEKLSHLLETRQFLPAIELWQHGNELVQIGDCFDCLVDLSTTLSDGKILICDTLNNTVEQLVTTGFDKELYQEVLIANQALNQPKATVEHVCSLFPRKLTSRIRDVLLRHLTGFGSSGQTFRNLCSQIPRIKVHLALFRVLTTACQVMCDFQQFFDFYMKNTFDKPNAFSKAPNTNSTSPSEDDEKSPEDTIPSHETDTIERSSPIAVANVKDGEMLHTSVSPDQDVNTTDCTAESSGLKTEIHDHISSFTCARPSSQVTESSVEGYTRIKLIHTKQKIWREVQRLLAIILSVSDLSSLEIEDYLEVLKNVNIFISIGEDFAQERAKQLIGALREQTLAYVHCYHRRTIDELVQRFNAEDWVAASVPATFNLFDDDAFLFLRQKANANDGLSNSTTALSTFISDPQMFERVISMIQSRHQNQNHEQASTIQSLPSEEIQAKLDDPSSIQKSVQNSEAAQTPPPPHCCQTVMHLVKCIGRYTRMMTVLVSISDSIHDFITQLLDVYVYIIFHYFTQDGLHLPRQLLSPNAQNILMRSERIMSSLIEPSSIVTEATTQAQGADGSTEMNGESDIQPADLGEESEVGRQLGSLSLQNAEPITIPHLSDEVPLNLPSTMYALPARATALEGLSLQRIFIRILPKSAHKKVQLFQNHTVEHLIEIHWYIYKHICEKILDYPAFVTMMSKARFDTKEVTTEHSQYVDELVQHFTVIHGRLSALGEKRLPLTVNNIIWAELLHQANRAFIDGFSAAKKCTNEGRAKMQMDYKQFLNKIKKFTTLKPNMDIVQNYVTAYYLPEEELEKWIRDNYQMYSQRHLTQLVNVALSTNKKARQRLNRVIEELATVPPAQLKSPPAV